MTRKRILIAIAVLAVPALALAWWLGSPLFIDRAVDEEFPLTADAAIPAGMTRAQVERTMETMAMLPGEAMDEAMPAAAPDADAASDAGADAPDAEAPAERAPAVVKRGMFRDADGFHRGEGSATLYRLADGSHTLRFEDFRVTNGPDLRVLLVAHPDPGGRSDVRDSANVELDRLKGNVGNQNYPLPPDVSPDDYESVVIYCRPFQVVFSVAPLSAG